MTNTAPLKIVVFREGDMLIAQCIDHDICTQAADLETLRSRMDCLIEREIADSQESGQAIDPAPERFHNMWSEMVQLENTPHHYRMKLAA